MRTLRYALAALLALAPAAAEAQSAKSKSKRAPVRVVHVSRSDRDCCWGNRFSFEPYAGAMKDAYDHSPDGENTGYLVGFRVGYMLGGRSRLVGNIGYSESDDLVDSPPTPSSYFVYDNTWVMKTAGGEFDVVPGAPASPSACKEAPPGGFTTTSSIFWRDPLSTRWRSRLESPSAELPSLKLPGGWKRRHPPGHGLTANECATDFRA